jgi:hypothetical protein
MIHFDFIVSDEDALNIFSCIEQEINNLLKLIQENTVLKNTAKDKDEKQGYNWQIKWYHSRINYLKELKTKMANVPVKDKL